MGVSKESNRLLLIGSGSFLAQQFLEHSQISKNWEVVTLGRRDCDDSTRHYPGGSGDLNLVKNLIADIGPTHILNTVGIANGGLDEMIHYNVELPRAIFEGVDEAGVEPRIVLIGSAAEYGIPLSEIISEDHPLDPVSDYGESKKRQTELAMIQRESGADVVVARIFNILGKGLGSHLVFGSFVKQILAMGAEGGVLEVGNLETMRDFLHVQDAVDALDLLLTSKGEHGVYNLASGRAEKIRDLLDFLILESGKGIRVQIDESRLRKGDVKSIAGSHQRLTNETGWKPRRSVRTALSEMLLRQ